jgi:hypothetical protein
MKCATKDRNLNPCRGNATHGKFCKIHHYMTDYTDDMVAQAKPCGTCRKTYYMGEYTTCGACRERGGANREKNKGEHVKCAKDGCAFKQSENKYCGKHQLFLFLDEVKEAGMKACVNAVRGCRSQMEESYKFTRCQDCLKKDREKDHVKRSVVVTGKQCTVCCKDCPPEMFEGARGTTLTCKSCREANKRADEKRDAEHVKELARKNAQKPARKAVKKAWKEENYESVALYCLNHRQRQIENDLDGYHAHNAEVAKAWRDKNPEKVQEAYKKKNENIDYSYLNYKRNADLKQLNFELSKEEFYVIVKTECSYCGIMQEKGFNGIDRLVSTIGYIKENCVSCCAMCNFMKKCLDKQTFLNRIEHILSYNRFIEGRLFPDAFRYYNPTFISYLDKCYKKGITFEITEDEFRECIRHDCYLCGKATTDRHTNGIDRLKSYIGYTTTNIYTCCGSCNYMKNNSSYKEFIDKCLLIYEYSIKDNDVLENAVVEIRDIVKGNKLSSDVRKEQNRMNKQAQRDRLIAKYGDEEYKRMHAKQIAENRRKNG